MYTLAHGESLISEEFEVEGRNDGGSHVVKVEFKNNNPDTHTGLYVFRNGQKFESWEGEITDNDWKVHLYEGVPRVGGLHKIKVELKCRNTWYRCEFYVKMKYVQCHDVPPGSEVDQNCHIDIDKDFSWKRCADNRFKEGWGDGPCIACSPGTEPTNFFPGGSGAQSCSLCKGGWISPNGYPCQQCLAGQYSTELRTGCRTCPAGSWSNTGVTSESDCTPCSGGTYRTLSMTGCKSCPDGHYSVSGSTSCTRCPAGESHNSLRTGCVKCSAGTFKNDAGNCQPCPSGTWSGEASTSCSPCNNGLVANFLGFVQVGCTRCPENTYTPDDGLPHTICMQCNAATSSYTPPGSSQCSCLPGFSGTPSCDGCSSEEVVDFPCGAYSYLSHCAAFDSTDSPCLCLDGFNGKSCDRFSPTELPDIDVPIEGSESELLTMGDFCMEYALNRTIPELAPPCPCGELRNSTGECEFPLTREEPRLECTFGGDLVGELCYIFPNLTLRATLEQEAIDAGEFPENATLSPSGADWYLAESLCSNYPFASLASIPSQAHLDELLRHDSVKEALHQYGLGKIWIGLTWNQIAPAALGIPLRGDDGRLNLISSAAFLNGDALSFENFDMDPFELSRFAVNSLGQAEESCFFIDINTGKWRSGYCWARATFACSYKALPLKCAEGYTLDIVTQSCVQASTKRATCDQANGFLPLDEQQSACYRIEAEYLSWEDSREKCRAAGANVDFFADLLWLSSEEMRSVVIPKLDKSSSVELWIGLTHAANETSARWSVDGSQASVDVMDKYSNDRSRTTVSVKSCAYLRTSSPYRWGNSSCTSLKQSFCVTGPTVCETGFHFLDGYCRKLSTTENQRAAQDVVCANQVLRKLISEPLWGSSRLGIPTLELAQRLNSPLSTSALEPAARREAARTGAALLVQDAVACTGHVADRSIESGNGNLKTPAKRQLHHIWGLARNAMAFLLTSDFMGENRTGLNGISDASHAATWFASAALERFGGGGKLTFSQVAPATPHVQAFLDVHSPRVLIGCERAPCPCGMMRSTESDASVRVAAGMSHKSLASTLKLINRSLQEGDSDPTSSGKCVEVPFQLNSFEHQLERYSTYATCSFLSNKQLETISLVPIHTYFSRSITCMGMMKVNSERESDLMRKALERTRDLLDIRIGDKAGDEERLFELKKLLLSASSQISEKPVILEKVPVYASSIVRGRLAALSAKLRRNAELFHGNELYLKQREFVYQSLHTLETSIQSSFRIIQGDTSAVRQGLAAVSEQISAEFLQQAVKGAREDIAGLNVLKDEKKVLRDVLHDKMRRMENSVVELRDSWNLTLESLSRFKPILREMLEAQKNFFSYLEKYQDAVAAYTVARRELERIFQDRNMGLMIAGITLLTLGAGAGFAGYFGVATGLGMLAMVPMTIPSMSSPSAGYGRRLVAPAIQDQNPTRRFQSVRSWFSSTLVFGKNLIRPFYGLLPGLEARYGAGDPRIGFTYGIDEKGYAYKVRYEYGDTSPEFARAIPSKINWGKESFFGAEKNLNLITLDDHLRFLNNGVLDQEAITDIESKMEELEAAKLNKDAAMENKIIKELQRKYLSAASNTKTGTKANFYKFDSVVGKGVHYELVVPLKGEVKFNSVTMGKEHFIRTETVKTIRTDLDNAVAELSKNAKAKYHSTYTVRLGEFLKSTAIGKWISSAVSFVSRIITACGGRRLESSSASPSELLARLIDEIKQADDEAIAEESGLTMRSQILLELVTSVSSHLVFSNATLSANFNGTSSNETVSASFNRLSNCPNKDVVELDCDGKMHVSCCSTSRAGCDFDKLCNSTSKAALVGGVSGYSVLDCSSLGDDLLAWTGEAYLISCCAPRGVNPVERLAVCNMAGFDLKLQEALGHGSDDGGRRLCGCQGACARQPAMGKLNPSVFKPMSYAGAGLVVAGILAAVIASISSSTSATPSAPLPPPSNNGQAIFTLMDVRVLEYAMGRMINSIETAGQSIFQLLRRLALLLLGVDVDEQLNSEKVSFAGRSEIGSAAPEMWDQIFEEMVLLVQNDFELCAFNAQDVPVDRRRMLLENRRRELQDFNWNGGGGDKGNPFGLTFERKEQLEREMVREEVKAQNAKDHMEYWHQQYNNKRAQLQDTCREFLFGLKSVTRFGKTVHEDLYGLIEQLRQVRLLEHKETAAVNELEESVQDMVQTEERARFLSIALTKERPLIAFPEIKQSEALFEMVTTADQVLVEENLVYARGEAAELLRDYCAAMRYSIREPNRVWQERCALEPASFGTTSSSLENLANALDDLIQDAGTMEIWELYAKKGITRYPMQLDISWWLDLKSFAEENFTKLEFFLDGPPRARARSGRLPDGNTSYTGVPPWTPQPFFCAEGFTRGDLEMQSFGLVFLDNKGKPIGPTADQNGELAMMISLNGPFNKAMGDNLTRFDIASEYAGSSHSAYKDMQFNYYVPGADGTCRDGKAPEINLGAGIPNVCAGAFSPFDDQTSRAGSVLAYPTPYAKWKVELGPSAAKRLASGGVDKVILVAKLTGIHDPDMGPCDFYTSRMFSRAVDSPHRSDSSDGLHAVLIGGVLGGVSVFAAVVAAVIKVRRLKRGELNEASVDDSGTMIAANPLHQP